MSISAFLTTIALKAQLSDIQVTPKYGFRFHFVSFDLTLEILRCTYLTEKITAEGSVSYYKKFFQYDYKYLNVNS